MPIAFVFPVWPLELAEFGSSFSASCRGNMEAILGQLAAVATFLESTEQTDKASHARIVILQANACRSLISNSRLSLLEASQVATFIGKQTCWSQQSKSDLITATSEAASAFGKMHTRKQCQKFQNIIDYFLEKEWVFLLSKDVQEHEKWNIIVMRCQALGLSNPNEGLVHSVCTWKPAHCRRTANTTYS